MYDFPHLATLAAGVLATSFVSGIFGMAGGMLLMGILLAIMPLAAAMALHGVTQMASNGWRAWLWRTHIRWPIVLRFAAGSLVAAALLAVVAARPSKPVALLILGVTPFIGLRLPVALRLNVARPAHAALSGAICMTMQLLAGVSGPILDVFFVQSGLERRGIVATKAAVQALGHALKLAYFGTLLASDGGSLPPDLVAAAVVLALVGTQGSRRVVDLISDAQFLRWSRRLIVGISVAYLLQGSALLIGAVVPSA